MQGEFWRQVYFQGQHPVQYYRFTVHIPKKKQLYYQVSGGTRCRHRFSIGQPPFSILNPQRQRIITPALIPLRREIVPPLKDEYLMPAPQDLAYNISISSLNSWDELATWYANTDSRTRRDLHPKSKKKQSNSSVVLGPERKK